MSAGRSAHLRVASDHERGASLRDGVPLYSRSQQLRLPEFDDQSLPGARVVRRAAMLVIVGLVLLVSSLVVTLALLTVEVTVDASGTLEPARVWTVRARGMGTIAEVLTATGDTVRPGQALVRLDTLRDATALASLEAELGAQMSERQRVAESAPMDRQQAEIALSQAEARMMRARANLRQRMADFGFFGDVDSVVAANRQGTHVVIDGAVADVLQARADVDAARAQVARGSLSAHDAEKQIFEERRLRAQVAAGRVARAHTVLVAPAAGVVITERLERLPGAAVSEGDIVLEVADVRSWRALIAVRERDVHRVHVGDRATIQIPSLASIRDEPLRAHVAAVAIGPISAEGADEVVFPRTGVTPTSEATSASGYRVVVALDPTQVDPLGVDLIRRGYTVQAKIITRRERAFVLARDWVRDRLRG